MFLPLLLLLLRIMLALIFYKILSPSMYRVFDANVQQISLKDFVGKA